MNYLLILSGHENNPLFWDRLTANIPSIIAAHLGVICAKDLLDKVGLGVTEDRIEAWMDEVMKQASAHKVAIEGKINRVASVVDIKKFPSNTDCVLINLNIIDELKHQGVLKLLKGSVIGFNSNFEFVEHCIVVFDSSVESIKNFRKFFTYFSSSLTNSEVILIMQIGKTLNDASRNKKAVAYMIQLFKDVGVITCPSADFENEIMRYLSLKDNAILVTNKNTKNLIFQSNTENQLQNKKIACYLDEF